MERRIKHIILFLLATLILAFSPLSGIIPQGDLCVKAADQSVQIPDEVNLYYLSDSYKTVLGDIPLQYLTSYKINTDGLAGSPTFKVVSGRSALVSKEGIITPRTEVWYWKNGFGTTSYVEGAETEISYTDGLTTVRVTCGDYVKDISVNVSSYAGIYVDNKIKSILAKIIKDGMSQLDQYKAVTKWVAENTDYNYNYSSANSMLIYGGGDCWASTNTIIALCEPLGINVKQRRGNQDIGSGSGHMNAIAKIDGKYYVAEAGYVGKKPRSWNVTEKPEGFSLSGSTIYQYDGDARDLVIPSEINGRTITGFGNGNSSVFSNQEIDTIHLPATITNIGNGAFDGAKGIKEIYVDRDNPAYCVRDGVLYTKDLTGLLYTIPGKTSLVIDENTTRIGYCGIRGCNLDRLVIPSNVKSLELAALYNTKIGELVIEEGLEHVGNQAFRGIKTPRILLPSTVKTIDKAAFYLCKAEEIILPEGITEIPELAFYDSDLVRFKVPDGVTSIGNGAFKYCYDLKEVTIPVSVTNIGENAFSYTSNLKNIYYDGTEEEWKQITMGSELPSGITVRFNSVRVTGAEFSEDSLTLTERGQTADLKAKILPADASNQEVTYISDNTSVAKVSGNVVTAVSEGQCNVTATTADGGYTAVIQIIVKYPRYKLNIIGGEIYYGSHVGQSQIECLKNAHIYIKYNKSTVTDGLRFKGWKYDEDIVVTSGSDTSSTIAIQMPDRDCTIEALYDEVKVSSLSSIKSDSTSLCVGKETDLSIEAFPYYALNKTINWTSGDEKIAVIDQKGHFKAISPGKVVITASTVDGSKLSETVTLTVKDHRWDEGVTMAAATCTKDGSRKYTCEICGETKEETVAALGHDWDDGQVTKEAGCQEKGAITFHCKRDGCSQSREEDLDPIGHDYKTELVNATCTEDGYTNHVCQHCGDAYQDKPVKAKGHDPVDIPAVSATCEKEGHKAGKKCSICGQILEEGEMIPATGHNFKVETIQPTCTEDGYTLHSCTKCDYSYKTDYTDAIGHTIVIDPAVEATSTSPGLTEGKHCSVCNKVILKQKVIPGKNEETNQQTYQQPGQPALAEREKQITGQKHDGDPKGSSYGLLCARVKKSAKKSNKLAWNRVPGASGYLVYGNRCGGAYRFVKIANVRGNGYVHKGLKKGTYYKYLVVAYKKISGKNRVIATSKTMHAATKGGKVGNCKKLKLNKTKVSLKRKKTFKIKAKEIPAKKKLKIKRHRKIAFESSNPRIATVTASGKIRGIRKGSCKIYVYAQNGIYKIVKVTVK